METSTVGGKYAKKVFIELIKINNGINKIYGLFDASKNLDIEIKSAAEENHITLIDFRNHSIDKIFKLFLINRFYSASPRTIPFKIIKLLRFDCEVIITIHGMRELEIPFNFNSLKYADSLEKKLK